MMKYYGIISKKTILLLLLLSMFGINCVSAEGRLANMGAEVFYQNFSQYAITGYPMEVTPLQYVPDVEQNYQIPQHFKGLYPYGFLVRISYTSYNQVTIFVNAAGYIDSILITDESYPSDDGLYLRCAVKAMRALGLPRSEVLKITAAENVREVIPGQSTIHEYSNSFHKDLYCTFRYVEPFCFLIDYMSPEDRFAMP